MSDNTLNPMESKNINDYLHLYLGCEAYWQEEGCKSTYHRKIDYDMLTHADWIKPILRPLSDMTEEEGVSVFKDWNDDSPNARDAVKHGYEPNELSPDQFLKLLSKGFDLFGLIDAGLAIKKSH